MGSGKLPSFKQIPPWMFIYVILAVGYGIYALVKYFIRKGGF